MIAAEHLVAGLAWAHAAWLWFWLCGSLVVPPKRGASNSSALLDVILASMSGMAITAIVSFVLGLLHALVPLAVALAVPILFVALWLRGDSVLQAEFVRARWEQLSAACTPGALIVWMIALFLSVPAIVPDNGSDATVFYLPQAAEYAKSHALVVDGWFRYPWYPNNWVLIQTWPFVLGVPNASQFLTWLAGSWTLIAIYGIVAWSRPRGGDVGGESSVVWLGVASSVAFALSPIFQRYSTLGMIDVPSGAIFISVSIAVLIAVRERSSRTVVPLVLCAAFLVGTKVSYVALLPLFAGLLLVVARYAGLSRRSMALVVAVLLLLSSPWYARAFVLAKDPVEPFLNLRLHGVDPKISAEDLRGQLADLHSDNRSLTLLELPWRMFADPQSRESRDLGVTLLIICLPLPVIYLVWCVVRRAREPSPPLVVAIILLYAYGYWNLTSHLERYALLFLPLFAAFVGIVMSGVVRRRRSFGILALITMLLFAVPSPASATYYAAVWDLYYRNVGLYYTGDHEWLVQRSPAYPQLEDLAHLLRRAHALDRRLYVVELGGGTLMAQELGVKMIGDAFGPGRFADLGRAVSHDVLGTWLRRLGVGALLVDQTTLDRDTKYAGLQRALGQMHWRAFRYADSTWVLYVAPDLPRLVIGEGHGSDMTPVAKPAPSRVSALDSARDLSGALLQRQPRSPNVYGTRLRCCPHADDVWGTPVLRRQRVSQPAAGVGAGRP